MIDKFIMVLFIQLILPIILPETNFVSSAFEDLSALVKICQVATNRTCKMLAMIENLSK